jgi:hypothetical protein
MAKTASQLTRTDDAGGQNVKVYSVVDGATTRYVQAMTIVHVDDASNASIPVSILPSTSATTTAPATTSDNALLVQSTPSRPNTIITAISAANFNNTTNTFTSSAINTVFYRGGTLGVRMVKTGAATLGGEFVIQLQGSFDGSNYLRYSRDFWADLRYSAAGTMPTEYFDIPYGGLPRDMKVNVTLSSAVNFNTANYITVNVYFDPLT